MKRKTLNQKRSMTGWFFLLPASILIFTMSFLPVIMAFKNSLYQTKAGVTCFVFLKNYSRMFQDRVFLQSMRNTFTYLIIQVPIMLLLALFIATLLNRKDIKGRYLLRTMIFLPCATSLVGYAKIFQAIFSQNGLVNTILLELGIIHVPYGFLTNATSAKIIIILGLLWRWTGYNMIFFLAGLQNIDYSVYEAAKMDGASSLTTLFRITIPLLRPTILLTAIMSTNGTLQLFDESVSLTNGGPANATISMSHYIYNTSFVFSPNFNYASAMSFFILVLVAILAFVQMKVGDKRD